jgi:hypothetical protein
MVSRLELAQNTNNCSKRFGEFGGNAPGSDFVLIARQTELATSITLLISV